MEMDLAGQTLGAYRIIEQIGRGGMAAVYKAYEPALDRYVAIKILPQYFVHDPDFAARFEREAKAVAKLDHPNILPIYSFGQEAGLSYIAMRYVEAGTLKEMLGRALDLKTTADILGQIGRALDYAHQRGVVHRDVKPTNVLMAEGNWALLTDFGLARMVESSVQLTKSGVGVGTPAYMSPEQGQGIRVDARSDVYSLGVVLYEMVTGKVPYEAETPMAVVIKHITAPLPLPREVNPDLPEAVERVILKAMAKAPEDRYQTAGKMMKALERAVAEVPVVEKPPEVKPVPVEEVPSTVVAEPTPAPAAVVPVEAPPVARKGLPGWVWGVVGVVVLLIAAGGVFLATQGERPSPTPEATAALVATPSPAMDVAPMVYDDFNNPAYEGSYNKVLWELWADQDQVAQRDGAMVFTQEGKPNQGATLAASEYLEFSLDRPTFFEARLMLSPDANAGNVQLHLHTELAPGEIWYAECDIDHWEGKVQAGCFDEAIHHGQVDSTHGSESVPVQLGSWHTLRMEVDPATMTFNYFVDGQFVGSHIPSEADRLKKAKFTLSIGIYTPSADALTGYVDDVRIGPLEALTAGPIPPSLPKPVSPGEPPPDAREIQPCQWDNRGPGLCIYPLGDGEPTQILENMELVTSEGGAPSWSPDGRQIAFSAVEPGEGPDFDSTIYIVNADGTGLSELPQVGNDTRPAWSPDGEWLAFHSSGDLAMMRPDGSEPTVIWRGEGCTEEPQWSPDSQWIAVIIQTEGCEWTFPMMREVRVISRDGATVNTVATLTHKDGECVWFDVAFSPDGKQVAYNDANCKPWIVNADGSGQAVPLEGFPFWWKSMVHPQWGGEMGVLPPEPGPPAQPEEGKIVEPCEGVTPPQICVRDAQTGWVTQVSESLDFGLVNYRAAWSPDGQQIVFSAGSDFEVTQRHDYKLYLINADGSDLRPITSGDTNDIHPVWSPDGDWIAFHRNCGLWVIRPGGSKGRMLLEGTEKFCAVMMAWSPDSQQIAFVNIHDVDTAPPEVWVINRDGTDARVVYSFERPLELWEVAWSPDGQRIACWYEEDGKGKGLLINADGSGEPKVIDEMPWAWLPNFWPQWGGEKKVPPPPPPSTPEAAPVPADPWGQVVVPPGDPIHMGLVADFSGAVSWLGPINENAVQMAIDDQGPVKGFPMSVTVADGGCQSEMGTVAAQAMAADPSIVGVIGHTCSSSCGAGAPVYEGAHLVMISPSCTGPDLSGPGYQVFNRVQFREDQGGDERNLQPVNTDVYQDFAHRYQERYSQSLLEEEGGVIAAYAYDATVILIKAIKQVAVVDEAGNLTIGRQALANAVRSTPGHQGVTGIISFDGKGDRLP
jgi:Tol biopolymer transport system component